MSALYRSRFAFDSSRLALAWIKLGLRLRELRPALIQLLIELRRVDLGEQVAVLHLIADVNAPLAHVAVGARVNDRLLERLHAPRKLDSHGRSIPPSG